MKLTVHDLDKEYAYIGTLERRKKGSMFIYHFYSAKKKVAQ